MATFIDHHSPIWLIQEMAEPFAQAAERGEDLTFDPELCRAIADTLAQAVDGIQAIADIAEAEGLLLRVSAPTEPPRRTPVERRLLAATAAPLDPERRVLAFPVAITRPVAVSEGGSAA